jgi:hypothetical protein
MVGQALPFPSEPNCPIRGFDSVIKPGRTIRVCLRWIHLLGVPRLS